MVGAAVFFQVMLRLRPKESAAGNEEVSGARMHAKLMGLSVLGIAFNQAAFLRGLGGSTPFTVSVLGATIPVLTAALAVLFRKERASWRTGLGLVLSLSGVLWLTGLGAYAARSEGHVDRGAGLVALSTLSYSLYVVFSRDVVRSIGSRRLMAWAFLYAALLFAPLGMPALVRVLPLLTLRGIVLLAYIVAVPTVLAYGLNAWALARSSASTVTIYIYLQPLIAGLLARIQLGDGISSRAGLAAVLILAGLGVTTVRRRAR
jgi:drug/metabolite transporter (DMT)-like permease